MSCQKEINGRIVRVLQADVTDLDIDGFVFYAQSDLKLGSGFGSAISIRGGPTVQEELDKLAPLELTHAVVSGAGNLKANHIIHANGPKFQEAGLEDKLKATVLNALKAADGKGIKRLAMPPMGTGFYGVPLDTSARVSLEAVREYLRGDTMLEEVTICAHDNREFKPFEKILQELG